MADTGDAKEWRDRYYVSIYFSLYRDYRIVRMADAQGNVREGIFIPFIQNGIEYHTRTLGNDGIREAVFVVEDVKDEATGHGTANGYVARASVQIFNRDGSTAR